MLDDLLDIPILHTLAIRRYAPSGHTGHLLFGYTHEHYHQSEGPEPSSPLSDRHGKHDLPARTMPCQPRSRASGDRALDAIRSVRRGRVTHAGDATDARNIHGAMMRGAPSPPSRSKWKRDVPNAGAGLNLIAFHHAPASASPALGSGRVPSLLIIITGSSLPLRIVLIHVLNLGLLG